jgi:MFS family permease
VTRWIGTTFSALENRYFRIMWVGSLFSFVAFFMSTVVQAVLAFQLTGSNSAVGFVVFGQGIAQLIFGPLGGALADRISKKKLILFCQALPFLGFAGLGILVATDNINVPFLVAGSFLNGVSFSFMGPARQAYVIELIEAHRRGNAVAINQIALNASRVVGPAIAGALLAIAFIGVSGSYFTMAAFYAVAIGSMFFIPGSPPPDSAGRSVLGDIAEGFNYVASNPRLRTLVLFFVLVMMAGFPYVTVLPGFVENQLDRDATVVSIMLSVTAVGALIASMAVASFADSPKALFIYSGMSVLFGVSLILSAISPGVFLAIATMLLVGIGSGGFQTLNGAVVIRESNPRYFGRVMSLTMLAFAGFGLMGLPIGYLADAVGERVTLGIMGTAVCAITIVLTSILLRLPAAEPAAPPVGTPGGGR